MPKQLKKFCKITRYIEQIDGELSQMITDLCLDRLFIPRGVNGITFLYPKEKSYRNEIIQSAYSDNPEKAIQMLESLIILDYLPRPGDFVLKKDDIPNSLRQKIEVTSADASSVKLTCGAVLTPDSGFAPISTRENMAFYNLKGKQIPLNGVKSIMKYTSKRRIKKGGRTTENSDNISTYSDLESESQKYFEKFKEKTLCEIKSNGKSNTPIEHYVCWLQYLINNKDNGGSAVLKQICNAGHLFPLPMSVLVAMNPLSNSFHSVFENFLKTYQPRDYIPVTEKEDLLAELNRLITLAWEEFDSEDSGHGSEEERLKIQQKIIDDYNIPGKQIKPAHEAYKKYYETDDAVTKFGNGHSINFIFTRLAYDMEEEKDKKSKAEICSQMFDIYSNGHNSGTPIILDSKLVSGGKFDSANVYSCLWLFIRSSLFLGGPPGIQSIENASIDPDAFDDPPIIKNTIDLHTIIRNMFSAGVKSKFTVDGIKALLGDLK